MRNLFVIIAVCWAAGICLAAPPGYAAKARAAAEDEIAVPDTNNYRKLLVQFRAGTALAKKEALLRPFAKKVRHLRRSDARRGRIQAVGAQASFSAITLEDSLTSQDVIQRLRRQPDVAFVELDFKVKLFDRPIPGPVGRYPDDFDFRNSWGLENIGQNEGKPQCDIDAPAAWALTTGSSNVVVAVIDTGIDYLHPDLAANIWTNPFEAAGNGLDDDQNTFVDDVHGFDLVTDDSDPYDDSNHGTHVAGVIGAAGDNHIGIAGICWSVRLMAIKAFDERGEADTSTVIEAIEYAIANGAQIINASWGQSEKSKALELVVKKAHDAGLIFVAAAGNEKTDAPSYPAAYEHVLAVSATDDHDQRAGFANYGPYVDLAAPGVNVYSTFPNNSYEYLNGTSMAAPHVTGVAALVLSLHPEFKNDDVENILRNTTDPIIADKFIGTGRLNARKALEVTEPLPEAILAPLKSIAGVVKFSGSANGPHFARYRLEYGRGPNPDIWTIALTSSNQVKNATLLEDFDTTALEEGDYTFHLVVENANGQAAQDRAVVTVRNVQISSPQSGDILRAGDALEIRGTVWGRGRTYELLAAPGFEPSDWSSTGLTLTPGARGQVFDGVLGRWDTAGAASEQFYTLKLVAHSPGHENEETLTYFVYLDSHLKPGWPVHLPIVGDLPIEDWRQVVMADLDGDGKQELILVDPGNSDGNPARLLVYSHDAKLLWQQTLGSGPSYADIPVVGDVDGDGRLEIFTDIGNQIFAFSHDGKPLKGAWPIGIPDGNLGKVLADVNGDGVPELVAYSQGASGARHLYVISAAGIILRDWISSSCDTSIDAPKVFPAVGNLDDDKELEIVAFTDCKTVAMFDWKTTNAPVWTRQVAGNLVSSPVIGDIDHDGRPEIIFGCGKEGNSPGGLYILDRKGVPWRGFPILNDDSFIVSPSLGDLDGDGKLYISVPSASAFRLHLLRPNGFEAEGWPIPIQTSTAKSGTVIGDVDGDGKPDIAFAAPGFIHLAVQGQNPAMLGGLKAWNKAGEVIPLNDGKMTPVLLMEGTSGDWDKCSPAILGDLDGDGILDAVAMSIQDRTSLPAGQKAARKNRSSIYAWSLGSPYRAETLPWPAFQQNARHTGAAPLPRHTNQPPVLAEIPDQIIAPGGAFFPVALVQYAQDPDHSFAELAFRVTGSREYQVNLSSNVVTILPPDSRWTGEETLTFEVTDPEGGTSRQRAEFTVREGYVAPVVRDDKAITTEDTPVEIDVLANDGVFGAKPLTVLNFSKPAFGSVSRAANGALTYTPKPDFAGMDTFVYTATDGAGGLAMGTIQVQVSPVNDPPRAFPDTVLIQEDTPTFIDALENDADPDGDPLVIRSFEKPQHGTVTLAPGGKLFYVPDTNYNGLDGFSYTIADPSGLISSNAVSILINPVNDLPACQDQVFTLNRNASVTASFLADDPDKDELTFKVLKGPDHGELYAFPKVATYYPTNGFTGDDSFTYVANDGKGEGRVGTVLLHVLNANNPPACDSKDVVTKQGQSLLINLSAKDLDKDDLVFSLVSGASHGTVLLQKDRVIYEPAPGYVGSDRFSFQASDGKSLSAPASINVSITDQNTAPEAHDSVLRTKMNVATNLVLDVSDAEANPLTLVILTNLLHGTLSGPVTNLVYTPETNYVGSDRFTYRVSDGELESKSATVTVAVRFPNTPPQVSDQAVSLLHNESIVIPLQVADVDGDALVCPILKGPKFGLLTANGTNFTYKPRFDFQGSDSFTYKAWDGRTYGNEARVTITVLPPKPPSPPQFIAVNADASGEATLQITGEPGRTINIYSSTNLARWQLLHSEKSSSGTIRFSDPASNRVRFYKATAN